MTPAAGRRVEVHAHRGARSRRPENTVPAFEYAVDSGADALELDVHVTRDLRLVVSHSARPDPRLCLGPGGMRLRRPPLFFEMTLDEVRRLDCGTLTDPAFPAQEAAPGARIPTLGEVFEAVDRSRAPGAGAVRFHLETKGSVFFPFRSPPPAEFARLVVEEARRAGMLRRVVLQSFDYRLLAAARALEPDVRIAASCGNLLQDLPGTAARLRADEVSPYHWILTRGRVEALHARGVRVIPWTVNDPRRWETLARWQVDGIVTDDPEALITFLAARPSKRPQREPGDAERRPAEDEERRADAGLREERRQG